jgi:hypothetical protein
MSGADDTVVFPIEEWSDRIRSLRNSFHCGSDALDTYIRTQASRDVAKKFCSLFAAVDREVPAIAGFYTLSMYSVNLSDVPSSIRKKIPKYPLVPAVLLGRLAVDCRYQKLGLGEDLLLDAMKRLINNDIAWWAMVVSAKEESLPFYLKYGFCSFNDEKYRLFLPHETIRKAFE